MFFGLHGDCYWVSIFAKLADASSVGGFLLENMVNCGMLVTKRDVLSHLNLF